MILQSLLMVTLLAADLDITAAAYGDYLGYEVVQTGIITETCAGQRVVLQMFSRAVNSTTGYGTTLPSVPRTTITASSFSHGHHFSA